MHQNLYRSIILGKSDEYWIYVYLFAKKDRANIEPNDLIAFRKLAVIYQKKSEDDIRKELASKALTEICHGKTELQK